MGNGGRLALPLWEESWRDS